MAANFVSFYKNILRNNSELEKKPNMNKLKSSEDLPVSSSTPLKGVNRALQVLEYVAVHKGRAIDISEGLDLSWATLHRTLQQLEQGGFLQKNPDTNQYSVGSRMWFIGSTYVADHAALEIARPYLERAAKAKGVTVQFVEQSGKQSTVLFSLHSGEAITKAATGYHFPLHAGSKGQVLLASSSDEFIDNYIAEGPSKLTKNTITDPNELRQKLTQVREDGYAITIADVQLFSGSVAAPVFDAKGKTIACVCFVTRKSFLLKEENQEILLESLLDTSQSISMSLGWRP